MPEYLAPGVYVEEISTGPRPIEGVSTSTAGFVGETERGPTRPTLVTSWADFQRDVRRLHRSAAVQRARTATLPYAVRGFFDNGGQRAVRRPRRRRRRRRGAVDLPGAPAPRIVRGERRGHVGQQRHRRGASRRRSRDAPARLDRPAAGSGSGCSTTATASRNPFVDPTDPTQLGNPEPARARRLRGLRQPLGRRRPSRTSRRRSINGASQLIRVIGLPGAPNRRSRSPACALAATARRRPADARPSTSTTRSRSGDRDAGSPGCSTIRDISLMAVPDEVVDRRPAPTRCIDACDGDARTASRSSTIRPTASRHAAGPAAARHARYGALYYPWVRVLAPHTPDGHRDRAGRRPRGRHLRPRRRRARRPQGAGQRGGPRHRHAATSTAAASRSSRTLDKREQDILNPRGVNVIRDFRSDGRDIRVWGARTMSSDAMWKYINVRRLFIFIEQSIDRGTQWVVFEPNYEPTWIADPHVDHQLPAHRLAQRRADGHDAGRGVLRQVRPHDDDAGRLRQRPADLPHRRRAGQAGRVRHLPHLAEDARGRVVRRSSWPTTGSRNDPLASFNFIVDDREHARRVLGGRRPGDRDRHHRVPRGQRGHHRPQAARQAQVHQHQPQARLHARRQGPVGLAQDGDGRQDAAQGRHDHAARRGAQAGADLGVQRGLAVEVGRPGHATPRTTTSRSRRWRSASRGSRSRRRPSAMRHRLPARPASTSSGSTRTPQQHRASAAPTSPASSAWPSAGPLHDAGQDRERPAVPQRRSASAIAATAYLAYAVTGFFENGGRTCWVVRAADPGRRSPARVAAADRRAARRSRSRRTSPGALGQRASTIEARVGPRPRSSHVVAQRARAAARRRSTSTLEPAPPNPRRAAPTCSASATSSCRSSRRADRPAGQRRQRRRTARDSDAARRPAAGSRGGRRRLGRARHRPPHRRPDARSARWGVAALERVDDVVVRGGSRPHGAPSAIRDRRATGCAPVRATTRSRDAQTAMINSCLRSARPHGAFSTCRRSTSDGARSRHRMRGCRARASAAALPPVDRRATIRSRVTRPRPLRPAVGPRGRHVRPHRPAARRAQAAGQRGARGRATTCRDRLDDAVARRLNDAARQRHPRRPRPRRARARRPHARSATSAGATSTSAGCSR